MQINSFKRYYLCSTFLLLLFYGCGSQRVTSVKSTDRNVRKMVVRDEGLSQLSYIDLAHPEKNWYVSVPAGRDLQLVGKERVLVGTGNGYEEREIATGVKVNGLSTFPGTIAARRLRNGNTLLTGLNWQGKKGILLVEVDKTGAVKRLINYPEFNYVRLVRETVTGTFLITSDDIVFEGNTNGTIVWRAKIISKIKPHAWQALRLSNGKTIVSAGYGANLQIFGKDGKLIDSISGPAKVNPAFFAGFQIINNGNIVVSNWQGHGPGNGSTGIQVLEYTPKGELAWSWKQDASRISSIQGIIVLDGLNLNLLHVEDKNGKLVPVK